MISSICTSSLHCVFLWHKRWNDVKEVTMMSKKLQWCQRSYKPLLRIEPTESSAWELVTAAQNFQKLDYNPSFSNVLFSESVVTGTVACSSYCWFDLIFCMSMSMCLKQLYCRSSFSGYNIFIIALVSKFVISIWWCTAEIFNLVGSHLSILLLIWSISHPWHNRAKSHYQVANDCEPYFQQAICIKIIKGKEHRCISKFLFKT
jgi:hypothetical protein